VAPAASLWSRWQVVQSLAPISSRPLSEAAVAAGAAGAAAVSVWVAEEVPEELHARIEAEPISKKRIAFFIVSIIVLKR
jgi:hypothetical protein